MFFLADVYAILICCRICVDKGYKFTSARITRQHFLPCVGIILLLTLFGSISLCSVSLLAGNRVTLYWVPGHSGVHGNEVADELARNGSSIPFVGPEPATGIASNLIGNTVFNLFRNKRYLN